jgi:hypothetical protein
VYRLRNRKHAVVVVRNSTHWKNWKNSVNRVRRNCPVWNVRTIREASRHSRGNSSINRTSKRIAVNRKAKKSNR